jgi:hypothetical protein
MTRVICEATGREGIVLGHEIPTFRDYEGREIRRGSDPWIARVKWGHRFVSWIDLSRPTYKLVDDGAKA